MNGGKKNPLNQSQAEYDKAILDGLSPVNRSRYNEIASDDDQSVSSKDESVDDNSHLNPLTHEGQKISNITSVGAGNIHPHQFGEQDAVGGSASHPETDDDIDDMHMRTFGNIPNQTDEIPNLADEIDKDEQAIRES